MTWERPAAWGLLALAVPLVILHLRWRRRREAQVPSLAVWRELGPPGAGRRGLRTVEDAVQLAALLVALVAFTAALAGPVVGDAAGPSRRLAIVLDVSATMNARDEGRTRFDAAREAAVAALGRLGPGDDVVVWAASASPRVVVEPTRDVAAVREGLAALRPTLEPGGAARTLDLARRALGPGAGLLLLTDPAGAAEVRAVVSEGETVGVAGGGALANRGIADVSVDAEDGRVRVRVVRTDGAPAASEVALVRDGTVVARAPLGAGESSEADLPLAAYEGRGGVAEVRLLPADDFAPDDVAWLVLRAPRKLRVAVATAGGPPSRFLLDALRAMPALVDAEGAVLVGPDAPAEAFAGVDVVLAEDALPVRCPRDRPAILFGAPGRAATRPALWATGAHPVLAGADLTPLRFDRTNVLDAEPGERVLVECAEGAVLVAGEADGVRSMRAGFRPDATTLPLEAAFPILVRNALAWLARPPVLPPSVRAGAPVVTAERLPPVDRVWVEGPGDLPPRPVRVREGALAEAAPLPTPDGPRILRLRGLGDDEATAVNWFPPAGFTLGPGASSFPSPADAVASLPDRRGNVDTRAPLGAECAVAGALALAVAAVFLGASRRSQAPAGRASGAPGGGAA